MSVDLKDLVPAFRVMLSPPGQDLYAALPVSHFVTALESAFWQGRLDGLWPNYVAEDGEINPISGSDDMGRDLQQLIMLYAAWDGVLNELRNVQSSFKAKAGPVEYEVQKSAQVLKEVLTTTRGRIREVVANLSSYGANVHAYDALILRTDAIYYGDQWWVR